jgi:hypothetical protein
MDSTGLSTSWFWSRSRGQPSAYVGGMVTRSVPARVVVPLAAAALLAGCGGGDTPPLSTSSTSTTRSPSPASASSTPSAASTSPTAAPSTATPTARIPTAAKAHTKAGAEAFVRGYFDVVNEAWTTPTAAELGKYAKGSCKSCAASLATASELVAKHRRYDGNPVRMVSVSAQENVETGTFFVATKLIQERRNVVDAAGKVVLTDRRVPLGLTVALEWNNGRWLIQTVKRSS